MSDNIKSAVIAKAHGFMTAIDTMGAAARTGVPDGAFGRDYNRLRGQALKLYPDLADLLPPEVELGDSGTPEEFSKSDFNHIRVYTEQIYQILSEHER